MNTFDGMSVDFGDHVLFNTVMSLEKTMHYIFSNDSDFYSFPEDFFLLTTNQKILNQAKSDKRLYAG